MDIEEDSLLSKIASNAMELNKFSRKKTTKKKKTDFKWLTRKRQSTTKKSQRQALLTKLQKKRVQSRDEVMALMINEGIQANSDEAQQMFDLANIMSKNKRISLPRNLLNGTIKIHCLSAKNPQLRFVTSDVLPWVYYATKELEKKTYKAYLQLESVRVISSGPFKIDATRDIKEFYVNDWDITMSAPTFVREGENFNFDEKVKTYTKKESFVTYGYEYNVLTSKDYPGETIFTTEKTVGYPETFKKIKEATVMKTESGTLKKGIKAVSKNVGVYFFDRDIKLTTFCPASVDLGKKTTEFQWVYEFDVDPDAFISLAKKNKDQIHVLGFDNMMEWNNIENFMILYSILKVDLNLPDDMPIVKLMNYFFKYTEAFRSLKKHYNHFERIALTYLDSFSNRINLDKLAKLLDDVNKYIADDELLKASKNEIDYISTLFNADKVCFTYMNNFLSTDVRDSVDFMKHTLEQVTTANLENKESIELNIRSCAAILFDFLLTGKKPVITTIRSPGSFLTNVIGDQSLNSLKNNLDAFFTRMATLRKSNEEIKKAVNDLVKTGQDSARQKLLLDVANLVQEDKIDELKKYLIDAKYINAPTEPQSRMEPAQPGSA